MQALTCSGSSENPILQDQSLINTLQKGFSLCKDHKEKHKKISEAFFSAFDDIDRLTVGRACKILKLNELYPPEKSKRMGKRRAQRRTPSGGGGKRSKKDPPRSALPFSGDSDGVAAFAAGGEEIELEPGTKCPTCDGDVPFGNVFLDALGKQSPVFMKKSGTDSAGDRTQTVTTSLSVSVLVKKSTQL